MGRESQYLSSLSSTPVGRTLGRILEPCLQGWNRLVIRLRTRRAVDRTVTSSGVPVITGTANVSIARRVRLHADLYFETRGQGSIAIGESTVVCRGARIVSHAQIRIGRGVFVGEFALLRDLEDPLGLFEPGTLGNRWAAPILIGDEVWIGPGVTIMPGVTLGDGAVVGANAVVVQNVPPGLVVAGIPARPCRSVSAKDYQNQLRGAQRFG